MDEYDVLRLRWADSITGGAGYDPADPDFSAVIARITTTAQTNWNSLNNAPARTYLWSDLPGRYRLGPGLDVHEPVQRDQGPVRQLVGLGDRGAAPAQRHDRTTVRRPDAAAAVELHDVGGSLHPERAR